MRKIETIREFRQRIENEGYCLFLDSIIDGVRYYRVITPGNRQFTGTIPEVKNFIGE